MKDLQVVALIYRLISGYSIDYSDAEPLQVEEEDFRLELHGNKLRVELKRRHSTEEDAKESLEEYLGLWEFHARLEEGMNEFRFEFERAEIKHLNPDPRFRDIRATLNLGEVKVSARIQKVANRCPHPPSCLKLCPDASVMSERYWIYRSGGEPLLACAYFCLTVLECAVRHIQIEQLTQKRAKAAKYFFISSAVLNEIGKLTGSRGGVRESRKSDGINNELTTNERKFLDMALRKIINRVAEKAFDPGKPLREITLLDLPTV